MDNYQIRGEELRRQSQSLVMDFMNSEDACRPLGRGMRQAEIFRHCGLAWCDFPLAKSKNQVSWLNALLWDLESQRKIEIADNRRGRWRLTPAVNPPAAK